MGIFGTQHLPVFIISGLLLNITPGQDTFYIVGRSIAQGRRAGVLSVFGISSGCVVHTLAAAFGVAALVAASPAAFALLKTAGACYLVFLGARMVFERPAEGGKLPDAAAGPSSWAIYRQGVLTNVLNPKVALFFLAFLPQFVDPHCAAKSAAMLFLGAVFIFNATLWCLFLAWCAAEAGRRLRDEPSLGRRVQQAAGVLFVVLGLRLAMGG